MCDLILLYTLLVIFPVHCINRYRIAKVEWIEDIYPLEGTAEKTEVNCTSHLLPKECICTFLILCRVLISDPLDNVITVKFLKI